MSDRELLELAAKATGFCFHGHRVGLDYSNAYVSTTGNTDDWFVWSPLTDDGDALRLAVKLGIGVYWAASYVHATQPSGVFFYESRETDDPYAATRRAIVRAAAAMGEVK